MPAYKDASKNTWYVKFRYKDWMDNTKWVTKRGFSTKREALQWERDFIMQKTGNLNMSFADFVKVYLNDRGLRLKESTSATKEHIIETKLIPYFGKKPLQDITSTDVIQWQNTLLSYRNPTNQKPYSKSYLKTVHNQLTAIFNHAVRFYGLRENPARIVGNMGSEKDIQMDFWTQEEYSRFAEAMMDEPRAYYCFEVLYWCGIREGELLALTPADFDFTAKTVSITKTFQHVKGKDLITDPKTAKSRRVVRMPDFLCDEICDYLRSCYDIKPDERLFPVTKSYLYRMMKKGCDQQGLRRIRVHDLRHSHVSLLINLGFNAVDIADRLGHESIDITYRYAHMFPSAQTKMANSLNQVKGGEDHVAKES
jgi:integrase